MKYPFGNILTKSARIIYFLTLLLGVALASAKDEGETLAGKLPVKVVVVTMFESDRDEGDKPGEFQYWVEREKLNRKLPFPAGVRNLRMNEQGVLAVSTGEGTANAAVSLTALALDERFDLSNSYWIIAGTAGGDPLDVSLGSAVWVEWVVSSSLAHNIDSREIPQDWPYGLFPLGSNKPNLLSDSWQAGSLVWVHRLNGKLVQWAYQLTKDEKIPDVRELAEFRSRFKSFPNALQPPKVVKGDSLAGSTYWNGPLLHRWANDWVKLYTENKGNFMVSNMEDKGILTALQRLSASGRLDFNRVLILRTVSSFVISPPGLPADWNFNHSYPADGFPGLKAAYQIGSRVVHELIENWDRYENTLPENN